jgi:acid phosphatase family membrane protein YuiD
MRGFWVTCIPTATVAAALVRLSKTCLRNIKKLKRNLTILAKRGAMPERRFFAMGPHLWHWIGLRAFLPKRRPIS